MEVSEVNMLIYVLFVFGRIDFLIVDDRMFVYDFDCLVCLFLVVQQCKVVMYVISGVWNISMDIVSDFVVFMVMNISVLDVNQDSVFKCLIKIILFKLIKNVIQIWEQR